MDASSSSELPLEEILQNVLLMTEIGIDLKERCAVADKYLSDLKLLFSQANRAILTLQTTSKYSLQQAKKILNAIPFQSKFRNDYDKLLGLIENQLSEFDEVEFDSDCPSLAYITEKIKFLESKQKLPEVPPCGSNKSMSIDEKYPENWSRDSSIDLNSVVNLPPVPEDVFTTFSSSANKPKRSSSLSSLKSMRKVKLFLQRAETSDEDEVSSDEELGQKGDSDDNSSPKKFLGNIKEETPDTSM